MQIMGQQIDGSSPAKIEARSEPASLAATLRARRAKTLEKVAPIEIAVVPRKYGPSGAFFVVASAALAGGGGCDDRCTALLDCPARQICSAEGRCVDVEPTCQPACASAADCSGPLSIVDEDNVSCVAGRCLYDGCNCDAECDEFFALFGDFTGVCRDVIGSVPQCFLACATVEDCANPDDPAQDADNFECVEGGCVRMGCLNTPECVATTVFSVCAGP